MNLEYGILIITVLLLFLSLIFIFSKRILFKIVGWLYIVAFCAHIFIVLLIPLFLPSKIQVNEKSAVKSLRLITDAETKWFQQDADGNGAQDYWTYDVSCFHRMFCNGVGLRGVTKVALISFDLARADALPVSSGLSGSDRPFGKATLIENWVNITPQAKSGYWFRSMLSDEKGDSYNQQSVGANKLLATNHSKYAFVAYPDTYGKSGINTYIVNENGKIWGNDSGGNDSKIVLQWPGSEPEKKRGLSGKYWRSITR